MKTTPTLAFIDTETTGLDARLHDVWEVAVILRAWDPGTKQVHETERVWRLDVDLFHADPQALRKNGFYTRHDGSSVPVATFAAQFVHYTMGAHLVGINPGFDVQRLERLLRDGGQCPMWEYQPIDVKPLAAQRLLARAELVYAQSEGDDSRVAYSDKLRDLATPPWHTDQLAKHLGLDLDAYDRHRALGDAHLARDMFDVAMGTSIGSTPHDRDGTLESERL